MRVNIFKSIIAFALAALLAYGCYCISGYESVRLIVTIGSFVAIGIPLFLALGLESKDERGSVLLRVASWLASTLQIAVNFVFAFFDFSIPFYIILNGLILIIFALIYRGIYKQHL